jgi:hypothetical protein
LRCIYPFGFYPFGWVIIRIYHGNLPLIFILLYFLFCGLNSFISKLYYIRSRSSNSLLKGRTDIISSSNNPYNRVQRNISGEDADDIKEYVTGFDNRSIQERYTHKDIINIALVMSPLWFMANCLYNYSLLETSVGSSTIIR